MSASNPASAGNQRAHHHGQYKDRAFARNDDQKNYDWREQEERERSGLHRTAPHDGRYHEGIRKHPHEEHEDEKLYQHNPVAPALMHGNEPSKGAKIDEELRQDDELRMKQKEGHRHDQE
ncbi:hypothetical protein AAP_03902 [Ascosphaera apis ARSEF 7405]|uniref:Uncharacterized protein n=1 Tax=Ascosphaera apis ARSEF 7405 TaxID=392613 RepID=A0A167XR96_9EURO|nr:hypothetical protein AAP_03902 [Ascosphaera apis ARSEF 7405]